MSSGNSAESMPRPAVRHQRRASRDGSEYGFSNARLNHGHRRAASRGEEASFAQTERVSNYDRPSVSVGVSPIHANAGGRLGRKPGSASPALDRRSDGGGTPGTPSRSRAQPERHASPLPKFGEWDVNNPSTAEEFTFIFDKARDEKKTGKAFRMDSPLKQEQVASKNQHGNHESTSWFCRCFQPSTTA
ncbi:hypothetical protein KP509_29G083300 [Ceratopteris richardii]|nr:hypothetical protein KP509_29G083300 [Ceratopteris richardii]